MSDGDCTEALQQQVMEAAGRGTALEIVAGGSKRFYGRPVTEARPLDVSGHRGVVLHEPKELVVTARAGTPLDELERILAAAGQMLPFEPPHFGPGATLGGVVACGLSGPARPYRGAVRDFVLGMRVINGRGEVLHFGGEVMKNVAGYDVSRLMTGALGTLGVILEVSLKVLPRPEHSLTLRQEREAGSAIREMNRLAGQPLPLTAAACDGLDLYLRLSGTARAVEAARKLLGGEELAKGEGYWSGVREQRHAFFAGDGPLWRLSLPPACPPLELPGRQFIDWGGAQRWLVGDQDRNLLSRALERVGGHAALFRGGDRSGEVFHPLPAALARIHRQMKQAFDPRGVFNPGRLYRGL